MQADNRIRAWYMSNMAVGLLYECNLGDIKPDCPVGERTVLAYTKSNGHQLLIFACRVDIANGSVAASYDAEPSVSISVS